MIDDGELRRLGPTVNHAALLAAGFTRPELRRAVRDGRLAPIVRGTYLVLDEPFASIGAEARILSVAQRSPEFLVSHRSAAVLHGLPVPLRSDERVHLTHHTGGTGRSQSHRVIHSGRIPDGHRTVIHGVKTTTVARTLIDLCRTLPFAAAVIAADHVLAHRLASHDEIISVFLDCHHVPGIAQARRALEFADGRSESGSESLMRVTFHRVKLPPLDLQIQIFDHDGVLVGRADAGLVKERALFEFDGRIKYSDPYRGSAVDAVIREKRREDRIRELACAMGRFGSEDLAHEHRIVDRANRVRAIGNGFVRIGAIGARLVPLPPVKLVLPEVNHRF